MHRKITSVSFLLILIIFQLSVLHASTPIDVTKGKYVDKIEIYAARDGNYTILRSFKKNGPYKAIDDISGSEYVDNDIEPGVKYWYILVNSGKYKIGDTVAKVPSGHKPVSGHSLVKRPRSMNLNSVINSRNKKKPSNITSADKRYINFLEPYYMNYFKLNLILFLAKPYVSNGRLTVLEGFIDYSAYRESKKLIMFGPDYSYAVLFQPGKMFRMMKKVPDKHLYDQLIKNGVAFCRYLGKSEVISSDGKHRVLPLFEAYGMPTHYYPKYKNWKSNTIMFGTSNKKLKEELLDAEKKGR